MSVNGESREVHIGLYPEDNGEIAFEIYSEKEGEEVVHSQGRAILSRKKWKRNDNDRHSSNTERVQ